MSTIMDQKKLNPVGERGTVMLNSTSKEIFKYFPLVFTDSNTSDLLFLLMVFFVSQQRPMCHDQLYKIQLRKKYNTLSLSSFSFCKTEKKQCPICILV